jgi:hypothetical protein
MATYNLTTTDLDEHVVDANEILNRVYTDVPLTYRIKDIVVTDNATPSYTSAPTITIDAPPVGGVQATAVASLIKPADGVEATAIIDIYVTNHGSGYTTIPAVSVDGGATNAVAILEIDPLCIEKRNNLINTINFQVFEESIERNGVLVSANTSNNTTISTALATSLTTAINANTTTLQQIRDSLDVTKTNNIASIVRNIDASANNLINKTVFDLSGVSGSFVLGEVVSTSTASGRVMHFDNESSNISVGYLSGEFLNSQTITGETSTATATTVINDNPSGASNDQIARAMMLKNLKDTGALDDIRAEINNPTNL